MREQFHQDSPRRVASCGYQTGLTVIVNTDTEDYYSAAVASLGALVSKRHNLSHFFLSMARKSQATELSTEN